MPFKQITIIGAGLIGGSFALAVKAASVGCRIIGCDRRHVLDRARAMRAIDTLGPVFLWSADPVGERPVGVGLVGSADGGQWGRGDAQDFSYSVFGGAL